jgi:hypothetical protein
MAIILPSNQAQQTAEQRKRNIGMMEYPKPGILE